MKQIVELKEGISLRHGGLCELASNALALAASGFVFDDAASNLIVLESESDCDDIETLILTAA